MLTFEKKADCFHITAKIFSFIHTTTMTVDYSFDLTKKRVNNDPWRDTTQADRDWFEKYYRHKFEE